LSISDYDFVVVCWFYHFSKEADMFRSDWAAVVLAGFALSLVPHSSISVKACCPSYPTGFPVVNADQTVIILWDAATKTQHFIRQASFKSAAADFGFLIPTPSKPELDESGDSAFDYLRNLTEPEVLVQSKPRGGFGIGCSAPATKSAPPAPVQVLEEKRVAGFDTVVLKADSADALTNWLSEHNYHFSPEVKAWAAPYVEQGWNITALKVAKDVDASKESTPPQDGGETTSAEKIKSDTVAASSLRMSFKTDAPLFPYREPDSVADAAKLGAKNRLLRIYFISDVRYAGGLGAENTWSGYTAWAGPLAQADRSRLLELLKLPESAGPAKWWLTEFEDHWAYRPAQADVTFKIAANQEQMKRPPIIHYTQGGWEWPRDVTLYAVFAVVAIPPLVLRFRRKR
jgi:hypothetical protein